MPRNAFNIWEVLNPVCCHGNKTVKLELWSTCSRIVLQRKKNICDSNWLRFLSSYLIKIWLSVLRHHFSNLHIVKTLISLQRKESFFPEIFENSKQPFFFHMQVAFLIFKTASTERCDFCRSTTLKTSSQAIFLPSNRLIICFNTFCMESYPV